MSCYPLGTNLIEGIIDGIEVLERTGCGFSDDACVVLEIRAACPGVGR